MSPGARPDEMAADEMTQSIRIAVVGGGVGGLAAAWEAKRQAERCGLRAEVTVLEAGDRAGGSVRTDRVDGCIVEGGPDCVLSEKKGALDLIADLGLEGHLASTNESRRGTYVLWKGRLHKLPEGLILLVPTKIRPFVASRLFTWRGKLRMALDLVLPRGGKEDETLGDFIRRRLGDEALEKLGEPLVAGIHSGDPETMSIRATFPRFVDMEREERSLILAMLRRMRRARKARRQAQEAARQKEAEGGSRQAQRPRTMFVTLDQGLGLLVDRLVGEIGKESIHTGESVETLAKGESRAWRVVTPDRQYEADAVLLACPAHAAAGILEGEAPEAAQELRGVPYTDSMTVTLAYGAGEFPPSPDGFGVVIPKQENARIKAFTWVTSKFHDRARPGLVLIRCFMRAGEWRGSGAGDDEVAACAHEDVSAILGAVPKPLWVRVYRWERSMPQYVLGHLDRVARVERALDGLPGLALAGGAYHGSGIPDTVEFSRAQAQRLVDAVAGE